MKNYNNFIIPAQVLEQSHFQPDDPFAIHCGGNTLVVVPESMTAIQAVNAISTLNDITTELICALTDACGSCEDQMEAGGCPYQDHSGPGKCPYETVTGPGVTLTDDARRDMGIPLDAKLELFPDEGEGLVCAADYAHDITDVPTDIRAVLATSGVCLGRLDEVVMAEKEVWHG